MTPDVRRPTIVGWLMLLVVLISAVPTTGHARTRIIGSAFDPATYSVVVSPKKPRISAAKASLDRKTPLDHQLDWTPLQATIEPILILPNFELVTGEPYAHIALESFGRATSIRANGPRAPPAA